MSNKYAGKCAGCGGRVPARAGKLFKLGGKWAVAHHRCNVVTDAELKVRDDVQRQTNLWLSHMHPNSVVSTFNSGDSVMVNRRGRCEDAPCCGCCT